MAKRGPKPKSYVSTSGEVVPGLYRCSDGRWRYYTVEHLSISSEGKRELHPGGKEVRFTEADEQIAIAKFRNATRVGNKYASRIRVPSVVEEVRPFAVRPEVVMFQKAVTYEDDFWPWLKDLILTDPQYVARRRGIPELARLTALPNLAPSIRLADLIDVYQRQNPASDKSKRGVLATLNRLIAHADATTLEDLTQEALLSFKELIERDVQVRHLVRSITIGSKR